MSKKTQFKNQCVFCKKKSPSAEHIFPQWLGKILSYPTSSSTFARTLTTATHDKFKRTVIPKNTSNHASGQTTKKVCIECNNQWLSQIESTVQPVFSRIIRSEKTVINKKDQENLAKWAFLLAIKWDLMEQAISGYQPFFYSNFYEGRSPPSNTRIWIGFSGNDDIQAYHRTLAFSDVLGPRATSPNLRSTTLKIGPLVFYVLTHEKYTYDYVESANSSNTLLTQIHPFQTSLELHNIEDRRIPSYWLDYIAKCCGMHHSAEHIKELIKVEERVEM